jgi:pyruvate dehydrogenase E1 component alpha subunit
LQNNQFLIGLWGKCHFIRTVENLNAMEYSKGLMRCPVNLSIGQETFAVGVIEAFGKDNLVLSGHRGHAPYLAQGGSLKKFC